MIVCQPDKHEMILSIDPGLHACGCALWDTVSANDLIWAGLVKNRYDAHPENPTRHSSIWNGMVAAIEEKLHEKFGFGVHGWPDRLAIELPQVYVRSRSKGDPNDLIALAGLVGALVRWFPGMSFTYLPHDWKGTVPKDIMNSRIMKHLSDDEKSKIEKSPKSLMHNTIDAIGIGLKHLHRL